MAKNIQKTEKLINQIEKEEIIHLRISKFLEDFYLKFYEISNHHDLNPLEV